MYVSSICWFVVSQLFHQPNDECTELRKAKLVRVRMVMETTMATAKPPTTIDDDFSVKLFVATKYMLI